MLVMSNIPVCICIPTTEDKGTDSRVSEHFGRAPFHVLVDLDTMTTRSLVKEGGCNDEDHGHCMPVDLLLNNKVNLVLCKGLGRSALSRLTANDIEVFATPADTVGVAVEEYRKCRGQGMAQPHLCAGHHHH